MSKQSDPHEWLAFAKDDLAAAQLLLTDADLLPRIACFHAQQAAEKALKASLVHAGIEFRKTHDLAVLEALLPEFVGSAVGSLDLQQVQQWAVDARYRSDLPNIPASDAVAVVAISGQVMAAVAATLTERVTRRD